MKIILKFLCVLFSTLGAYAQTLENDFVEYSRSFEKELIKELSNNNNRQVIILIDGWIEKYRIQEDSVKAKFNTVEQIETIKANCFYEISTEYARDKATDSCLFYLKRAVDLGFSDLKKILNDTAYVYLKNNTEFIGINEIIERKSDWIEILKNCSGYEATDTELPPFAYQDKSNKHLTDLNNYFNLDSIAGNGDDISQILNLLYWTNKLLRHDGAKSCYATNAIDIYSFAEKTKEGVNCRAIATFLNECYLAIGLKSRYIACNPKSKRDNDLHVINHVYSKSLKKWIWVDPTYNAYFTDDTGLMLSIPEVRSRLIEEETIILNDNAMLNGEKTSIEKYLYSYMEKNLYWFQCPLKSMYNSELKNKENPIYISLYPLNYERITISEYEIITNDDKYFWEE